MVRHGGPGGTVGLALFLATWIFAGTTTGYAQARSTVSVGAHVVDARAAWTAHSQVQTTLKAWVESVHMTDSGAGSILPTGSRERAGPARVGFEGSAQERVGLERAGQEWVRLERTGLAIRRSEPTGDADLRIRVDYVAN